MYNYLITMRKRMEAVKCIRNIPVALILLFLSYFPCLSYAKPNYFTAESSFGITKDTTGKIWWIFEEAKGAELFSWDGKIIAEEMSLSEPKTLAGRKFKTYYVQALGADSQSRIWLIFGGNPDLLPSAYIFDPASKKGEVFLITSKYSSLKKEDPAFKLDLSNNRVKLIDLKNGEAALFVNSSAPKNRSYTKSLSYNTVRYFSGGEWKEYSIKDKGSSAFCFSGKAFSDKKGRQVFEAFVKGSNTYNREYYPVVLKDGSFEVNGEKYFEAEPALGRENEKKLTKHIYEPASSDGELRLLQYDFKGYKILTPGYGNMAIYKEDRVYDFLCKISENGSYDMSFDAETDREGDLVLSVASQKAQVTFYKDNFTKFLGDSRECVLEKSSFIQKVQESPAGGEVVPLDFNKMYAALFSGNPALKTKAQGEFRSSGQAGLKFLKKKLSEADSEERWLIEAVISTVK